MEDSKKERLSQALDALTATGGVEGAAIVTHDGLLVLSKLVSDVDGETFAAMSAAMTGAAETAVAELGKGDVERVIVESRKVKLVSAGAGGETIVVVLARPDANLGLVLIELKKATQKVSAELSKGS